MLLETAWAKRSWSPGSVFSPNVSRMVGPRVAEAVGKLGGTAGPWLRQQGCSRQGTLSGGASTAIGNAKAGWTTRGQQEWCCMRGTG